MKTRTKALLLTLCAVLLVTASVMGTMAYLTSTAEVTNTFTVGKVAITLDEAKVGADGKALTGDSAVRVQANSYKLMPGHTYDKDPTIHVASDSEDCYIWATVTLTNGAKWGEVVKKYAGGDMGKIITGTDEKLWYVTTPVSGQTDDTLTCNFIYKNESKDENLKRVWQASDEVSDLVLFKKVVMPDGLTNDEIKDLANTTITINAYAIQADGFNSIEAAMAAFTAPAEAEPEESLVPVP